MKKKKIFAIICCIVSMCVNSIAAFRLLSDNNTDLGIVWLCIGSVFLCVGAVYYENQENND